MHCINKNTPGVKKGRPRTKTGLAEKVVKSNGRPMSPGFDRLESFGHNELTVKHGAQGILMLMESKILIKMTRLQNTEFYLNVLRPGHPYQKF